MSRVSRLLEQAARTMAFSREEAEAFLRGAGRENVHVPTADQLGAGWRDALDRQAAG
jgi:hypothetical protein